MAGVLFAEDCVGGVDAPVDAQRCVEDGDAAVGLRGVVVVALVLEHGHIAQHGKAVGETAGHEELAMVVLCELHGHMLTVGGRAAADVDSHVEHGTAHAAHEFGLGERGQLEMQTAHHPARRARLVVLHEIYGTHFLVELALAVALEEIAAGIGEYTRLDDHHSIYISLDYFHFYLCIIKV